MSSQGLSGAGIFIKIMAHQNSVFFFLPFSRSFPFFAVQPYLKLKWLH